MDLLKMCLHCFIMFLIMKQSFFKKIYIEDYKYNWGEKSHT